MVANNQSIIYDIEANTETILPDIPNGVRVTNPFDGTATLLPLSPPLYIPEVLVCGGTNASDQIPAANLSSQDPASDQCSRITLTPAGIEKGWEVEHMLEGRMMPEMILLPTGEVLIINGAQTGYAAIAGVNDAVGNSNADNPVYVVALCRFYFNLISLQLDTLFVQSFCSSWATYQQQRSTGDRNSADVPFYSKPDAIWVRGAHLSSGSAYLILTGMSSSLGRIPT